MNKKFYVYGLLVQETGELFYIGKTFEGSKRYEDHIKESYKGSTLKNRKIFKELNSKNHILEIKLFESLDEKEILKKEKELISKYGRKDIGTGILCNHTNGGEGRDGSPVSKEIREKISKSLKGKNYVSKAKRVAGAKKSWKTKRKGFKHSSKTKKYISERQRKPVILIEISTGIELKFQSLYHLVESTDLSIHSVRDNLCGKTKLIRKKYICKYIR